MDWKPIHKRREPVNGSNLPDYDAVVRTFSWEQADDVIKSAGHLIGPFEVESVLMDHPRTSRGRGDRQA